MEILEATWNVIQWTYVIIGLVAGLGLMVLIAVLIIANIVPITKATVRALYNLFK